MNREKVEKARKRPEELENQGVAKDKSIHSRRGKEQISNG